MSELKTRPTPQSMQQFLASQPQARREDCETIAALMQAATGEAPQMWGSIVGFGRFEYVSGGKRFEWPLVAFSPRKQDLTIYLMPGFTGVEDQMARLGKHKTGKSCLYLKKLADIDTDVLRELIEGSVKAMEPKRIRR